MQSTPRPRPGIGHRRFVPSVRAATVALGALVAACGADPAPSTAQDTGGGVFQQDSGAKLDSGAADTGTAVDAGTSAVDAGTAAVDTAEASDADPNSPDTASPDTSSADTSSPVDSATVTADAGSADAGPTGLVAAPVKPGGDVKAIVTTIAKQKPTWVRPDGENVFLWGDKGLAHIKPASDETIVINGATGKPHDVAKIGKVTLIATSTGLWVLDKDKAKASPLTAAIAGKAKLAFTDLHVVGDKDPVLWIVAGNKLTRYGGGKLNTITIPKLDVTGAKLAWGPKVNGKAALWLAAKDRVAGIVINGSKVEAWVEVKDRPVADLAVDKSGRVWVASDGECLVRDGNGAWIAWKFPSKVTHMYAASESAEVFVRTAKAWWVNAKGSFHKLTQMPATTAAAADKDRVLIGTKSTVAWLTTTPPPEKPKTTWTKHVQPIYSNSCALCHSDKGVNTKLYKSSQWKSRIDDIIKLVVKGGMPLSPKQPLTPLEIAAIKNWKKDGFIE